MAVFAFTADTTQPVETAITVNKVSTRILPRTLRTEESANVSLIMKFARGTFQLNHLFLIQKCLMKKEIDELILVESYFFQFNYLFVSVSS